MSQQNSPTGSRMERKKEDMRQKIISTALELFREQGLSGTTMEQIAAEVDIPKARSTAISRSRKPSWMNTSGEIFPGAA